MTSIDTLNETNNVKIYWIFIYAYTDKLDKAPLDNDKILLFPLSIYTPFQNMALPTLVLEENESLDLSTDEDLDIILNKFNIKGVNSVSEMVINKNTNLVSIEIHTKNRLKGYCCHNNIFFYTVYNTPEYYINNSKEEYIPHIPSNKHLLRKIKINIGSKCLVNTNVTLKTIFSFIFKDYFESIMKKIELSKIQRTFKANPEDEQSISDGYETDDSDLSLYSYNLKYKIKDI
jgi:hypothetical protein